MFTHVLTHVSVFCIIFFGLSAFRENIILEQEQTGFREDYNGAFRTHCLKSHKPNNDPLLVPKRTRV